ncbi:MAG: NADH-quinone oxidoreductase subunit C [Thermoproteales archaeon]|nr:NADH-quinone oxidoreductase subunit C [Thermoproteales archaeon]
MSSIKDFLIEKKLEFSEKENKIIVSIPKERIKDTIKELWNRFNNKMYLATITGIDYIEQNIFEIDYEIWFYDYKTLLIIKTDIPRDQPFLDSIIDIIPGAIPYEQEIYDLLGVEFKGNKYLRKGFFVPSSIINVCPLRKDWQSDKK